MGLVGGYGSRVAWIKIDVSSKYSPTTNDLLSQPEVMQEYVDSWTGWFDRLPVGVRASASADVAASLPPPDQSVLTAGWVNCNSWQILRTQKVWESHPEA